MHKDILKIWVRDLVWCSELWHDFLVSLLTEWYCSFLYVTVYITVYYNYVICYTVFFFSTFWLNLLFSVGLALHWSDSDQIGLSLLHLQYTTVKSMQHFFFVRNSGFCFLSWARGESLKYLGLVLIQSFLNFFIVFFFLVFSF